MHLVRARARARVWVRARVRVRVRVSRSAAELVHAPSSVSKWIQPQIPIGVIGLVKVRAS